MLMYALHFIIRTRVRNFNIEMICAPACTGAVSFDNKTCNRGRAPLKTKKTTMEKQQSQQPDSPAQDKNCRRMPGIGEPAPAFEAVTTQGKINFPEDYKGRWVILFSHPSDFTPVCTSEFMTFAKMTPEFKALNTELLGLSVDGLYSHIAWIRAIKEKIEWASMKSMDISFPVIEDISMDVARKYGMIQPGESTTKAVRALFFIDPEGVVRAMIYYPMSVGRSFGEILRVLTALQTVDRFKVATPADWHPGDDVIVPTESTAGEVQDKMDNGREGVTCHDWFFCTKELLREEIDKYLRKNGGKK